MKKVLFILGELSDSDIEWLIATGHRENVSVDNTLIHEGKPIQALYIVLDGEFLVKTSALGDKPIASLGAGEMLGEMSYVDARPPSATVTSSQESLVLKIDRSDLENRLKEDDGFAARFYRALAIFLSDRLRGTMTRMSYGEDSTLQEDSEYEDELDLNVLDQVSMAGNRFERILRRLRGDV